MELKCVLFTADKDLIKLHALHHTQSELNRYWYLSVRSLKRGVSSTQKMFQIYVDLYAIYDYVACQLFFSR